MPHRFDKLVQIEKEFKSRHSRDLEPLTYTSGPEDLKVLLYKSPNVYHFKEVNAKKRILLHFTAGNLNGDLITLTPSEDQSNRFVSVPFVVARDGTIFQLFSSKHWAYNLGMKAADGNVDHIFEKESIAIEISNYGPLVLDGEVLKTPKDKNGRQDTYCTTLQAEAYQKLNVPFRNFSYFATYTEVQMASVIRLVRWLAHKYEIPTELISPDLRLLVDSRAQNHKGITSHINYRSSGKWDIGPAFDWSRFEQGIQAPVTLSRSRTRSSRPAMNEEQGLKGKLKGARFSKAKEEVLSD